MAAIPWAPDLPKCFLRASYSIEPQDNVIREPMDVGPPKQRVRSTVQEVNVTAAMQMTNAQRRSFLNYYKTAIRWGTRPFAFDDPDGVTRQYYMLAPPTFTPEGKGWRCDMRLWYIDA